MNTHCIHATKYFRALRECNDFVRIFNKQDSYLTGDTMENIRKRFKTVTFRLTEKEHQKLKAFAQNLELSLNHFLKKAIALDFNFKAKNVTNNSQFLSAKSIAPVITKIDKVILHAIIEMLLITRDREPEEVVARAKKTAEKKVCELTEE
jgi:hypothetical protein